MGVPLFLSVIANLIAFLSLLALLNGLLGYLGGLVGYPQLTLQVRFYSRHIARPIHEIDRFRDMLGVSVSLLLIYYWLVASVVATAAGFTLPITGVNSGMCRGGGGH